MVLRTRLLLGYSYLVILLVVSAAGSALGFLRLGTSIGRVLTDNFESVRASMTMLESLERQDSALLAVLLGDASSQQLLDQSEASFYEAIAAARANITMDQERVIISHIEQRFAAYQAARDELLASTPDRPLRSYDEHTFPLFEEVKTEVFALHEVNYAAMVEADRRAQRAAILRATLHGLLVVVALLSLAFLSQAMNRSILSRITELSAVAQAIGNGDLGRRAIATQADEIGIVARQLNTVLDRLQGMRGAADGMLALQRQLLLGLLAAQGPAALLALDGNVVATTLSDTKTEAAIAAIRELAANGGSEVTIGHGLRLQALRTDDTRQVGWLATVKGPEPGTSRRQKDQ